MLNMPFFRERGYLRDMRGPDDLSHARPVTLEGGERGAELPREEGA